MPEMDDESKSKEQLIAELAELRQRVTKLERNDAIRGRIEQLLRHSEESSRQFGENLVALVEITNELSMTDGVDALCRRAVELGRERLGFDRLGIWFRSKDDPDAVVGSFGVDEHGEVLDERGRQTHIDPNSPDGRVLLSREPLVLKGPAVDDARGAGDEVLGRGGQVFAAIWDGEQVIGHVSMDSEVRNEPITQRQVELLRLFGSAIGYLVTRKRANEEREWVITELQEAVAKVNTLSGLLPICASCKKVRDDKGYWNRIEEYIEQHSHALFSHSICPDCARKLYPEIYDKKAPPGETAPPEQNGS
jgi:hypothetical protein